MRAAPLAALALMACATTSAPTPFDHLRGCWIDRRTDGVVATMRWFPQTNGAWRGDQLTYFPDGGEPAPQAYRLQRDGAGAWQLCPLDYPHGPPCRIVSDQVLEPDNDYRATITASPERLRIAFVEAGEGPGEDKVLFSGARDGCD